MDDNENVLGLMPCERCLTSAPRLRPVAIASFEIVLVHLDADEIEPELRARHRRRPETEERIGDQRDRDRGRAAAGTSPGAAAGTSPGAAGPCRGSESSRRG